MLGWSTIHTLVASLPTTTFLGLGIVAVLIDDLVVGQPGPDADHPQHPGISRVEQRDRLQDALPGRMGECCRVRRIVRARLRRCLPRFVAAGGGLAEVQVEYWRRGPYQGDAALGRRPERRRIPGRLVGAEIDQGAGHTRGRRLPGVGVVVGDGHGAGGAHGGRNAHPQAVVARQPPVESQPVGLQGEARHGGQLAGQPVHIGRMTRAARSSRYATARSADRACYRLFGGGLVGGDTPPATRFRWPPDRYPLTMSALAAWQSGNGAMQARPTRLHGLIQCAVGVEPEECVHIFGRHGGAHLSPCWLWNVP